MDEPPPDDSPECGPQPQRRRTSISRFDAFQRRHAVLGFPIAVIYKYFDDTGPYLVALITYYGFVSLFPLLLILSTVLGLVLASDEQLRQQILQTALAQFPIIGNQLGDPRQLSGGAAGLVIGGAVLLYGGLGVGQALQYAMNTMWRVPRNSRRNPFRARARSLLLLVVGGLSIVATTALSIVADSSLLSGFAARALLLVGGTALSAAFITLVFRMTTERPVAPRQLVPGAIVAAVAWQALQSFGIVYVSHVVRNASTTNSVFALVLGLVAFIYIASAAVVLSVEINVVRVDQLYPRALLTPFTDSVVLTPADERAYAAGAMAQRTKGFERISVRFGRRGTDDSGDDDLSAPGDPELPPT